MFEASFWRQKMFLTHFVYIWHNCSVFTTYKPLESYFKGIYFLDWAFFEYI